MSKNYQDHFLGSLRRDHIPITVFLVNGFQLRGVLTGYDSYVVVIEVEGRQNLIFKHAISTIVPVTSIAMEEDAQDKELIGNAW